MRECRTRRQPGGRTANVWKRKMQHGTGPRKRHVHDRPGGYAGLTTGCHLCPPTTKRRMMRDAGFIGRS